MFRGPCTVTGATFRTAITTNPHTLRIRLWTGAGVSVADVDKVCTGSGQYTGTFSSPYSITDEMVGDYYYISMWETTGAKYTFANAYPSINSGFGVGSVYYIVGIAHWAAGDACPTSQSGANYFVIDPIIVLP